MVELHLRYSYTLFGSKPKRSIEKIEECKVLFYAVTNDIVDLIVLCPTEDRSEKTRHFLLIAYEIFPKKVVKL